MKAHAVSNNRAITGAATSARAHELQSAANELFSLHGRAADAPAIGETDENYQRRLLESAKIYSDTLVAFDFVGPRAQPREFLPSAWNSVVADGVRSFKKPVGSLRQVTTVDDSGRHMRHFYGDPENVWAPFKAVPRLAAFNPNAGRGANAPGAIKPVGVVMSDGSVRPA